MNVVAFPHRADVVVSVRSSMTVVDFPHRADVVTEYLVSAIAPLPHLLTEAGDRLLTEGGDLLTTES